MNKNVKILINEYKNYLIRTQPNTTNIYINIKSENDIKTYEIYANSKLKELEDLSTQYKLYDKDYEEYRIAIGKFALALSKLEKLKITKDHKQKLINNFIDINYRFEILDQKNIMKDAYVWKYPTR